MAAVLKLGAINPAYTFGFASEWLLGDRQQLRGRMAGNWDTVQMFTTVQTSKRTTLARFGSLCK